MRIILSKLIISLKPLVLICSKHLTWNTVWRKMKALLVFNLAFVLKRVMFDSRSSIYSVPMIPSSKFCKPKLVQIQIGISIIRLLPKYPAGLEKLESIWILLRAAIKCCIPLAVFQRFETKLDVCGLLEVIRHFTFLKYTPRKLFACSEHQTFG